MEALGWLALLAMTLGVLSLPSATAATSAFGPKEYRVPLGLDQNHTVLLTIVVGTNGAWQQGNDEPVTVTVDAQLGPAVAGFQFRFVTPFLWTQSNGNWAIVDGNPTSVQSNDSHVSVTVPEKSGQVLAEAWFQVQLSVILTYSNGSTYSLSGWTTGREFGPISVAPTPFYGISDIVLSPALIALLVAIPGALVAFVWYGRRRRGRPGVKPSRSSRRGT